MIKIKQRCFMLLLTLFLAACTQPEVAELPLPTNADQHNPEAAAYNTQLGIGYLREGNIPRAKAKLLLAQKQDPTSPEVWDALAYFYEATDNNTLANEYYLKAIKLTPKRGSVLNNYGAFLCKNGQYKQSLVYFNQAVSDPNYINTAATYENAGLCAEQIPALNQAKQFFTLALQNNPDLATSNLELGEINFTQGKYDLASRYLQRYNQLAKPSAEAVALDLRLAQQAKNSPRVQEDCELLKNKFSDSKEYTQVIGICKNQAQLSQNR